MRNQFQLRRSHRALVGIGAIALFSSFVFACPPVQDKGDELVQQLRDLPTPLPATAPGNGKLPEVERRRSELYRQIRQLGTDALPALQRGLHDNDVRIRRNVALVFNALAGGWLEELRPKLNVLSSLPELIAALDDTDSYVRGWSAQAIGGMAPASIAALPSLIRLLNNPDEGSRNSACIALGAFGPAARDALPALQHALSDSSEQVRTFARRAIENIQNR
jgi:HEAT repeat protein